MPSKPDFGAQFRDPEPQPYVYMGGTAMSCGKHHSLPKRHRWGPWKRIEFKAGGSGWERTCLTCALVSDIRWPRRPKETSDATR